MEYVRDFMQTLAPATQLTSLVFEVVDPVMHSTYLENYRQAHINSTLAGWTSSRRACFQGLAVVRNLACDPHKDKSDKKDGYVAMMCFGDFSGGELVVTELGMRFAFQPGDVVLFRSAVLEHYITEFQGSRTSTVFFCHQGVIA